MLNKWNTESIALAAGVVLVGIAGSASAGSDPVRLEPNRGEVRHAGHIYFNVATGEKITTLIGAGDTQGAAVGDPGSEIWIASTGAQCADFGYDSEFYLDLNYDSSCSSFYCDLNAVLFDWGDIAMNTVVDCVQVHWVTDHADTDTDSDGLADGVEGFGGFWMYWDSFSGRGPGLGCIANPIIGFRFYDLPGEYPVDTTGLAMWTADIDLGGSFSTSLTFEIGDTDSDLQGASVHNSRSDLNDADSDSIPDIDPDQDGLADWGWQVQFIQPGTVDTDNADGDSDWRTGIDGDITARAGAGAAFGSPTPGHAEFDSANSEWVWVTDGPAAGATEDAFTLGYSSNPDGSGALTFLGTFWFGGFDCSAGQTDGYTPAAHFQTVLYGQEIVCLTCCVIDLAGNPDGSPDGVLNFFDVSAFVMLFGAGDLAVDFGGNPDGSPDGVLNMFDVSRFLSLFAAGCP